MDIAELKARKATLEMLAANKEFCALKERNEKKAQTLIKSAMSEDNPFRAKALLSKAQGILEASNELATQLGEIELEMKLLEGEEQ